MGKRSRSAGVRHPVRWSLVHGFGAVAGIALVVCGANEAADAGQRSSPLLMLGLFPALLCPIFLVYYLTRVWAFRDLRSGRSAIARWTVPADQFREFCEQEQAIPAASIAVNYYRPPRSVPADGVEVIFSDRGVLIDGGWFPLSVKRGRRLQSVRYNAAYPPNIEFNTLLTTAVSTSSTTFKTSHNAQSLRVPVAMDARGQVDKVVDRYEALLAARRS